jgi:hypothetical protein
MFFRKENVRSAIDEAELVGEVIEALIASNGLSRLRWPLERGAATAAAASAVLLFKWKNSEFSKLLPENELHECFNEMRSGVDFVTDIATTLKVRNTNIVDALVSSYGLLEQNHDPYRLLCVSTPKCSIIGLTQMHNTSQISSLCDV